MYASGADGKELSAGRISLIPSIAAPASYGAIASDGASMYSSAVDLSAAAGKGNPGG